MKPLKLDEYKALGSAAVLVDRPGRARLLIQGPDRVKFLNNLTTQDVKRVAVGEGREAFVTSPQGKTLGHVILLATEDAIELLTTRDSLAEVDSHLRKYGVFDDVTIEDVSDSTFLAHLAGPKGEAIVLEAGGELPEPGELRHRVARIGGASVRVVRESTTGRNGLTLLGDVEDRAAVVEALGKTSESVGLATITPEGFEALRIEGGSPESGRDITPENLPQEVARDARAINFVKGCYLGQETVARIDALGHVNKVLRGLLLDGASTPPASGASIEADGKKVGTLTSSAYSPGWGRVVGLGYLRTSHANPGTAVTIVEQAGGPPIVAVVQDLPMIP